eukprot:m.281000 g.281000  ORF g.281000 m.281000 type:complete len:156 (-) comp19401_c3_seq10:132-599(-)
MFPNPTNRRIVSWWSVRAVGDDQQEDYNVLSALRDGEWKPLTAAQRQQQQQQRVSPPACMACEYPSWRWERMLNKLKEAPEHVLHRKLRHLARYWCSAAHAATSNATLSIQVHISRSVLAPTNEANEVPSSAAHDVAHVPTYHPLSPFTARIRCF